MLRRAYAGAHDAEDVGHATHRVPDVCMDRRGADPNEHLLIRGGGSLDLPELEDICEAVPVLDDRLHRRLRFHHRAPSDRITAIRPGRLVVRLRVEGLGTDRTEDGFGWPAKP